MKNPFICPRSVRAAFTICGGLVAITPLFSTAAVSGQPGTVDPTFNAAALYSPPSQRGRTQAIAVQPDGRIVVGGALITLTPTPLQNLARLNHDGSLDDSFQTGTGPNGLIDGIDLQPDGKILIAGGFTEFNGAARHGVARLNADGSLDRSFDVGTGPDSSGSAVWIVKHQADGGVLVGGAFSSFNQTAHTNLVRLTADGLVDESFSVRLGSRFTDFAAVSAVELLSDGRIYVTGPANPQVPTFFGLARLLPNGMLDESFLPPSLGGSALALQADGKLVIGGTFQSPNGGSGLARINPDGSVDETFASFLASGGDYWVHALAVQPDGRILVAGDNFDEGGTPGVHPGQALVRVDPYGAIDDTFAPALLIGEVGNVGVLRVLSGGKILAGINETTTAPLIVRLNNQLIHGIEFTSTSFLVNEGDGYARINLRRTGAHHRPALVILSLTDGTATAGQDYLNVSRSLVFRAGETEKSGRILIRQDSLSEGNETVGLSLRGFPEGTLALRTRALLVIRDDETGPPPE